MKNYSIWNDNDSKIKFSKLNKDSSCDVLIIGGGITGISAYYHLKKTNLKTILVEQNKIGMSTTSKSTGKLSFLQNDLLDKISNLGEEVLSLYLKSQIEAINLICETIKKEKITCDLEKVDSILYTNNDSEIKKIIALEKELQKNNIETIRINDLLVKSKYSFKVSNTYLFNPIKFLYGLIKRNDSIYENSSITKIEYHDNLYYCYSDNIVIKAKYVILACHYPYFNIPYLFPIKGTLEKSYLSASKYKGDKISLISYSNPFISIRTYQDYLIYLTNSHSINKDTCDKKHFNELIKKVHDLNLEPEYLWSNIDIMTNDGLPYIGVIKDNMLIATGYNTWGLASGFLAGKILSDIINEKSNEYLTLFDPKRNNLEKIIGGINSIYCNISGYINGFIHGKYQCTHMGCKLIYNELEHTFDCPCHGSRFDINGKVISSPANKDLKK